MNRFFARTASAVFLSLISSLAVAQGSDADSSGAEDALEARATGDTRWQTVLTIVRSSSACEGAGWTIGNLGTSVYRISTDGSLPGVTYVVARSALRMRLLSGALGTAGDYEGAFVGSFANLNTYFTGKVKITTDPATVSAKTEAFTAEGTVTNFNNNPSCTVTLRGYYTRLP